LSEATKNKLQENNSRTNAAKLNPQIESQPLSKQQTTIANISSNSTNKQLNTNAKLDNILQSSQKIPHPPPQSTRPTSSSARKIRLSSALVKNNTGAPQEANNGLINNNKPNTLNLNNILHLTNGGGDSSNEEDIHNSSSKTLFDYNANNSNGSMPNLLKKLPQAIDEGDHSPYAVTNQQTIESSAYSFSSKPKPVSVNNTNTSSTSPPASYDYRKYSSKTLLPQSKTNLPAKQQQQQHSDALLSSPFLFINPSLANNTTINNNLLQKNFENNATILGVGSEANQNFYNDLMDSFEAQMLQDMKAEMESDSKTSSRQQLQKESNKKSEKSTNKIYVNKNLSKKNQNKTKSPTSITSSPDKQQQFKTTNIDVEVMQREASIHSGIQSPLSDDYNPTTTSEKYNFDAMTSSIEDTTTSLSKKTSNRKTKFDESNNYQDEMNVSLTSNLHAKSINLKDLPLKYSPLTNHQQHMGVNKFQTIPIDEIDEEPVQYDDSQADIDEIISDSDDEIDLLYDHSLNCYYDPKTGTYYELNLS
jgi:hypothetical protein